MDVLDWLVDPWRSGIGLRALVEIVVVGAVCGALGFWVASYRLVYSAESLAHGLLPGLVVAAVAGVPLVAGAAAGILAAALLIDVAGRDERVGADTATAVVVTGLLGLGGLLALARDRPLRLEELLFGDPLAVGSADLAAAAILAAASVAALLALHRPLSALAFDPVGAPALGVRPAVARAALLVLLAAAVCVATRGLGNLLVLAVLVAPPVAVARHAHSPARAMLGGAIVAAAAGVAGFYGSYHLEVAAGASIALALCAAAALGALLPAQAGRRAAPR
jgi:ABC-type Mn2+/Zn2+ transport system permease subunit